MKIKNIVPLLLLFCFATFITPAKGQDKQEEKINEATTVLQDFNLIKEDIPAELFKVAHGIIVVPKLINAGFVLAGKRGKGLAMVKLDDGSWSNSNVNLPIAIIPAWWQTKWFRIVCVFFVCVCLFLLIRWRIISVRKQEQNKAKTEKELFELEAKALRSQMNPHFIFNCLTSIQQLIVSGNKFEANEHLVKFARLVLTEL